MDGLMIEGTDLLEDYGYDIESITIRTAPAPKTKYIDITGRDGSLDYTEQDGYVRYKDGTMVIKISKQTDMEEHYQQMAVLKRLCHGRKCKIILPYDPEYYLIAQCIHDLLPSYKDLNACLASAFTTPSDQYDPKCLQAAQAVFEQGERRFQDAEILQFRSFAKYSDGHGQPDKEKLANLYASYDYLGSDSISNKWGHFYFGKKKEEKKMSFRMLVMAGHGKNMDGSWDPGAVGCGYQEANLTRELRDLIKAAADRAGVPCDVAPDRNHYSYFKNGGQYDFTPYTYVLEVHFNASATADQSGDGIKKGSMFYIDRSETGHSVEDAILFNLYSLGSCQAWDGVMIAQRQWPSGLMVQSAVRRQGVSHAVLETCFISDWDDVSWYLANKTKIASAIVAGIQQGFGLNYTSSTKPYMVKVTPETIPGKALNIRQWPSTNAPITGQIRETMSLTIIEEASGKGAKRWGKLKSGAGWISLDYAIKAK